MSKALCIKKESAHESIESWKPFLVDRNICETDENLLQIIPYITLIDSLSGDVFSYKRGNSGAEARLHTKISIGLGGHIDDDVTDDIFELIALESVREIQEETGCICSVNDIEENLQHGFYDIIYNPESDDLVDKTHIGVVFCVNVLKNQLTKFEENIITESKWLNMSELSVLVNMKKNELELWSYIVGKDILQKIKEEASLVTLLPVEITIKTGTSVSTIKMDLDITKTTAAQLITKWQTGDGSLIGYNRYPSPKGGTDFREIFLSPAFGVKSIVQSGKQFIVSLENDDE